MSAYIVAAIIHLANGGTCNAIAVCAPSDAAWPESVVCEAVVIDPCAMTLQQCLYDATVQVGDTHHDVLGCTPDARQLTIDMEEGT